MHVTTRYFFAGGRASEPLVKDDEYLSEAEARFCWRADSGILFIDSRCY
jgi:hypothetical protein